MYFLFFLPFCLEHAGIVQRAVAATAMVSSSAGEGCHASVAAPVLLNCGSLTGRKRMYYLYNRSITTALLCYLPADTHYLYACWRLEREAAREGRHAGVLTWLVAGGSL